MRVQLKPESPDRVETGLGPRVYVFERGKPTEVAPGDWPELARQGFVELVPEEPATDATTEAATDKGKSAKPKTI